MTLTLRPLRQTDIALLFGWLNKPHLRPFYMRDAISREEVRKKFTPRTNDNSLVKCVIALEDDQPFGYMQWYQNRSFPDCGAAVIGRTMGVSIDYFIGDNRLLGRGLGSRMLKALTTQTATQLPSQDRSFHIGHDNRNLTAIRCTTGAGFLASGEFLEKEKPHTLYVLDMSK